MDHMKGSDVLREISYFISFMEIFTVNSAQNNGEFNLIWSSIALLRNFVYEWITSEIEQ
jgi:hypothetical protein